MDKKILMIDDKKEAKHITKNKYAENFADKYFTDEEVHVARTYKEGIEELKKGGYDLLLLDHDLGGKHNGHDVLMWLEQNPQYFPPKITLITFNPGVVGKMIAVLMNFKENGLIKEWDRVTI
jgi:DNA-binding response OmpR family regulator